MAKSKQSSSNPRCSSTIGINIDSEYPADCDPKVDRISLEKSRDVIRLARTNRRSVCSAMTLAGAPCRAASSQNDLCALHSDPKRASQLGQRSGIARRRTATIEHAPREFSPPKRTEDIKEIMAQVVVDVLGGRIDPKLAYTVAYAANTFMKSVELSDLVSLKELEIFHKEAEKRTPKEVEYYANHGCWPNSPFAQQLLREVQKSEGRKASADQLSAQALVAINTFPGECICFPPKEQPESAEDNIEEREAVAAVLCPLHGKRFHEFKRPSSWNPEWIYGGERRAGWPHRSPQYQKAMRVSFAGEPQDEIDQVLDLDPKQASYFLRLWGTGYREVLKRLRENRGDWRATK